MSNEKDEQPVDPLAPKGLEHAFEAIGRQAQAYKAALTVMSGKAALKKADDGEFPPTKFCPICRVMHSPSGIHGDTSLTSKVCEKCQIELDGGAIAVYCPDRRYAFLHSEALVGCHNVVEITNEAMNAVSNRMKEIRERDEKNGFA